jgi:hypothetical protein
VPRPFCLMHTAAVAAVVLRMGRIRCLAWRRTRRSAADECQLQEKRGDPSTPFPGMFQADGHRGTYPAAAIGGISLASLILTLPTRGLTGQHVISSDG